MARYLYSSDKITLDESIDVKKEYDVIICGGGVAGICAAVAAVRAGADTILIERTGTLGGTATAGMCASFVGTDMNMIRGIYSELVDRMEALGSVIRSDPMTFDPESLRTVLFDILVESGAELLLHTVVSGPVMEGKTIKGVVVENKAGIHALLAPVVIDATGDADVAVAAGAEYFKGREEDGICQPMSVLFRMGGVDINALMDYVEENPEEFYSDRIMKNIDLTKSPPCICLRGVFSEIREAREKGELYLDNASVGIICMPRRGEVLMNATEVRGLDPVDPVQKTKAEIEGRKQAISIVDFMRKRVPGFGKAFLLDTCFEIGVREGRRIKGDYIMTAADIIENRQFEDAIARNSFPMDFHGTKKDPLGNVMIYTPSTTGYTIPYRALLPAGIDGILAAGRCISTTHEAHASTRNMPSCMATGQAAGLAGALSAKSGIPPRMVNAGRLREALRNQGAIC